MSLLKLSSLLLYINDTKKIVIMLVMGTSLLESNKKIKRSLVMPATLSWWQGSVPLLVGSQEPASCLGVGCRPQALGNQIRISLYCPHGILGHGMEVARFTARADVWHATHGGFSHFLVGTLSRILGPCWREPSEMLGVSPNRIA